MATAGDVASIVGVGVSVVGFIGTIWAALRSRSAAVQAKEASEKTREDIHRSHAIADLSAAVSAMEEVKRLHRSGAWEILPDRYAELRKRLVAIKTENPDLAPGQKAALQGAIQRFAGMETKVEEALAKGERPDDFPRLNRVVGQEVDSVQQVLAQIQLKIGRQ